MEFTITMAVALVGSVGTVCLTVMKILDMRKDNKEESKISVEVANLKQHNAVQQTQIDELKGDVERLQTSFDKINDLLIRFLSSN